MVADSKSPQPSRRRSTLVQLVGAEMLMSIGIVRGIILVPLYLHYLGQYMYGAWISICGAIALMGLADLGITSLITQKTARLHGARSYDELGRFVATCQVVSLGPIFIILAASYPLAQFLPSWIGVGAEDIYLVRIAFLLASLEFALSMLGLSLGSILFGIQAPSPHMTAYVIGSLLEIGVILLGFWKGWGLLSLPAGGLSRSFVVLAVNIVAVYCLLVRRLARKSLRIDRTILVDLFRSCSWLFPAKLAQALNTQSDALIVAKVIDPSMVTVLSVTQKVSDFTVQAGGRVPASFLSGLAHLKGTGEAEKLRRNSLMLLNITMYGAAMCLGGVLLLNKSFVRLWVGPALFGGVLLNALICSHGFVKLLNVLMSNTVFSQGHIRVTATAAVVDSVVRICLGIVLCYILGLKGVALAALAAVSASTVVLIGRFLELNSISSRSTIGSTVGFAAKAALPIILGLIVMHYYTPESWITLTLCSAAYLIFAAVSYILLDGNLRGFVMGGFRRGPDAAGNAAL